MDVFSIVPLPFEYSRFIGVNSFLREYFDVKFTKDFGVFKEGESYDSSDIDLKKGELKVYEGNNAMGMQEISLNLLPINF